MGTRRLETSTESNSIGEGDTITALPEDVVDLPQHPRRLKATVPMIIPQREDLLANYARVDAAWILFKEHVLQIKDGLASIDDLVELKSLMATLEEHLNELVELCKIPDPYVPPPKPRETNLLFFVVAVTAPIVIICFPTMLACCRFCKGDDERHVSADNGFAFGNDLQKQGKAKNNADDAGVIVNM